MMKSVSAVVLIVAGATAAHTEDWPHWRGPTRNAITGESSGWNNGKWLDDKPKWTASVGRGASSPIVIGDRVYVIGWQSGFDVLRCLSARDGSEIWKQQYKCPQYGRHAVGDEGLYSGTTSTPEYDPATGLLYSLSCDGDLICSDTNAKGETAWKRNLYDDYQVARRPRLTRAPQRDYGYTSSPMVHDEWLLVEVGTSKGNLIAFDKKSGKEIWRSELADEAGHTGGPAPIVVDGIPCVAVLTQRNLAVIRLDSEHRGKTLAKFEWITDFANTIAGPAVSENHVLITSAYNQNAICKLRITLQGAVEVWRKKYPSKVCTPLIADGSVYLAWQSLKCLDWETGELRWQGGTFGDPGSCILTADNRIIVYGKQGKLSLVESAKRSPKSFVEVAVKDHIFQSLAWPHVAIAGGQVYCRDRDGNIACFVPSK